MAAPIIYATVLPKLPPKGNRQQEFTTNSIDNDGGGLETGENEIKVPCFPPGRVPSAKVTTHTCRTVFQLAMCRIPVHPSPTTKQPHIQLWRRLLPPLSKKKVAVNTNTDWENGVPIAHDFLHEIGEKLKKLPSDLLASGDFEINSSADVNSLSENIGPAVMTLKQRNVDRSW